MNNLIAEKNSNKITEEMNFQKDWYEEAKNVTPDTLMEFFNKLTKYEHDYGTICHAIAAVSLAAGHAFNKTEQGGITGFQAGAIMWEFIKQWDHLEGPARILRYDDLMFPQNEYKFNTISKEVWERTQEQAAKNLAEHTKTHPAVIEHWQSIVDGKIPFGLVINENN